MIDKELETIKPHTQTTLKKANCLKPSIFHPTTSIASTGSNTSLFTNASQEFGCSSQLNSKSTPSFNKNKKIKGSGFKIKHRSESNLNAIDNNDMGILTIGQMQEKLEGSSTYRSNFEQYEVPSNFKMSRVPAGQSKKTQISSILTESPNNLKNSSIKLALPNKRIKPSIAKNFTDNAFSLPNNQYTKYLAGKSNLNLKTELAFTRKKHQEGLKLTNSHKEKSTPSINGYLNFLNKSNSPTLTKIPPANNLQKLPAITNHHRNSDPFQSDSFTVKSLSKFSEASRTSFESVDFVKKISPQNKYDLQLQSERLNNEQSAINSAIDNSEHSFDYLQNADLYIDEYINYDKLRSCPSPTSDLKIKIENIVFSDYDMRTTRTKAIKPPVNKIQSTPRQIPKILSKPVKYNNLTKSMGNLTFNALNESIQNHIDELKSNLKPIRQNTTPGVNLTDSEAIRYLQKSTRYDNKRRTVNSKEIDQVPKIDTPDEKETEQEIAEKVSNINDKLYLDIFIPCMN